MPLKQAIPLGLQHVFAMFVGNLTFMHYLGDDGVGAFGIACYYIPFVFMVGNAIAQSAQPIISYNFGAGVRERVIEAAQIALATALHASPSRGYHGSPWASFVLSSI